MDDNRQLQVSRIIDAPPERIFAMLADPARHRELDGAGMLRGLDSGDAPITAAGQAFVMNMNQDGIGDYQMRSEIVIYEADRRIGWAPAISIDTDVGFTVCAPMRSIPVLTCAVSLTPSFGSDRTDGNQCLNLRTASADAAPERISALTGNWSRRPVKGLSTATLNPRCDAGLGLGEILSRWLIPRPYF